jgi:hypothetical protein
MVLAEWIDNVPVRTCTLLIEPSRFVEQLDDPAFRLRAALKASRPLSMRAAVAAASLAEHFHQLAAPSCRAYAPCPRPNASGVVVTLVCHSLVTEGGAHTEFTVLSCAPFNGRGEKSGCEWSEARLVKRRYNDFARLRSELLPLARRASLTLPPLPHRTWGRNLSETFTQQRLESLQSWLRWVVHHDLWCDALCLFLGLDAWPPTCTACAVRETAEPSLSSIHSSSAASEAALEAALFLSSTSLEVSEGAPKSVVACVSDEEDGTTGETLLAPLAMPCNISHAAELESDSSDGYETAEES